ncbi:hypothetical protein [Kribbella shirazensis]|uniref:Uncharacterized protein n=1 Tax=Kribbella shirazensis TaxID=1105143 RepID=A0A7X6A2R9_9ACTN|nr:hypothetical protein [Kribbella shirazensis]NIK59225.1 hypothetical protein [Kribbella shirazensis]
MGRPGFSFEGAGASPRLALYRAVWRVFCGVSVVLGVVAAGLLLPADILVVALLAVGVAAASAIGLYDGGETARWRRGQIATAAAAATAVVSLVIGVTVVLGLSVLWLAVLLAASSPPVVQWCSARLGFGTPVRQSDVPTPSTTDLCRQWRDSYEALRQARTDKQRLRIVMDRQHCLDELGRRDPEGLQAWLSSSASAAGDPARFLRNS